MARRQQGEKGGELYPLSLSSLALFTPLLSSTTRHLLHLLFSLGSPIPGEAQVCMEAASLSIDPLFVHFNPFNLGPGTNIHGGKGEPSPLLVRREVGESSTPLMPSQMPPTWAGSGSQTQPHLLTSPLSSRRAAHLSPSILSDEGPTTLLGTPLCRPEPSPARSYADHCPSPLKTWHPYKLPRVQGWARGWRPERPPSCLCGSC